MQRLRLIGREERGAAAVEFAFVLPILLLLVLGIVEFGRAYNAQITLSAAAREGARVMALENDAPQARTTTVAAAPSLNPGLATSQVTVSPSTCTPGTNVTVTATYRLSALGDLLGGGIDLRGQGVMRCGG